MTICTDDEKSPLLTDGDRSHEDKNAKKYRCWTVACMIIVLWFLVAALVTLIWIFLHPQYDGSPTVKVKSAAVASDAKPCSIIGTDILKKGGSAVDSAIATLLCMGVHNAQGMGIGGGFFMVVNDVPRNGSRKEFYTLDARETAPGGATEDMYVTNPASSSTGGLASGIPGEIRGYYEAWQKFGRLPWKQLFEPTIAMCRDGYEIGPSLGEYIPGYSSKHPDIRRLYSGEDGTLLGTGDIATRPELARTLEIIAEEGADAFYTGSLSRDIADEIQQAGGIITEDDLQGYRVKSGPPLVMELSEYKLHTLSDPSGGPVLNFMLNVLDKFDLDVKSEDDVADASLTYHKIIETFKFGYALRTRLGDGDFVDISEVMRNLTSHEFAEHVRDSIDLNRTHDIWFYNPDYFLGNESGTSHLSVLSPEGGAVSVTSSVNGVFGSRVVGNKTGILYNNQMDDFSIPGKPNDWGLYPSPTNYISPGKRPLSSMCPVIVTDKHDNVVMVTGGAGGSKITTITTFVAAHALLMKKELTDAIDVPRVHHQLLPNSFRCEKELNQGIIEGLLRRGHVEGRPGNQAVVQAITSCCHEENPPEFCITACSDKRKSSGVPDGY